MAVKVCVTVPSFLWFSAINKTEISSSCHHKQKQFKNSIMTPVFLLFPYFCCMHLLWLFYFPFFDIKSYILWKVIMVNISMITHHKLVIQSTQKHLWQFKTFFYKLYFDFMKFCIKQTCAELWRRDIFFYQRLYKKKVNLKNFLTVLNQCIFH